MSREEGWDLCALALLICFFTAESGSAAGSYGCSNSTSQCNYILVTYVSTLYSPTIHWHMHKADGHPSICLIVGLLKLI